MVSELAGKLQRAIEAGDFAAAQSLASEYRKAVQRDVELEPDAEKRKRLLSCALETLQDHLHLLRIMRAHISTRLQAVTGHNVYQGPNRDHHTWRFEA